MIRQSEWLIPTLKEDLADAAALSHRLMLRAGLIRQLSAGVYTYLPLGRKVLRKLEQVIRQEMENAGAQEVLLPAMQQADLWRQSGRYGRYGPELIRFEDRSGREFVLGPTHEEAITALAAGEIASYRRLPVILYQIQTKFRDEKRPRNGLLRGREFKMKDAYSFALDQEGLDRSYASMLGAYRRIFDRIGLQYLTVEADAGMIGGDGGSHEFAALADVGEDAIALCESCGYSANVEKAECGPAAASGTTEAAPAVGSPCIVHTPQAGTIAELAAMTRVPPQRIAKTLVYKADGRLVALLVRGDRTANEVKLKAALQAEALELADDEEASEAGVVIGFAGPVGLSMPIYADDEIMRMPEVIVGANRTDFHLKGVIPGKDFVPAAAGDFRNAEEGDGCPRCSGGKVRIVRGIEIGHTFKLGTKYSEAMKALCTDADGIAKPFMMGCYGIGVSRLLSAVAEQRGTERGIAWPLAIAPFQVHVIPVSVKDADQMQLAASIAERMERLGAEVLLDDREERAGVKFADADLIGIPHRIVVGKAAGRGMVEWRRERNEAAEVSADEAVNGIVASLRP